MSIGRQKTQQPRAEGAKPEIRTNHGHRSVAAEGVIVALLAGPAVWSTKTPRGYNCVDGTHVKHAVKMALAERQLVRVGRGADRTQPSVRCICLTPEGRVLAEEIRQRIAASENEKEKEPETP